MRESRYNVALSAEMEMVFAQPGSDSEERARQTNTTLINPDAELGQPSRITTVLPDMRKYYQRLRPTSDAEAATEQQWLDYLNDYVTPSDIVNFKIYEALSEPRLTYAAYPLGTPYATITSNAGQLEFRGPGKHQEGWYDAGNISESRMAPTPNQLFVQHRAAVIERIGALAAQEGHRTYMCRQDINGSIYQDEIPLLGSMDNLAPYRAAIAGLHRVFAEGGLINSQRDAPTRGVLYFSPLRSNVRIIPGRIEYRGLNAFDGPDYNNGPRFLNAGMRYGEQHTSEEERSSIGTATMLRVEPSNGYSKDADLPIRRYIEACAIDPSDSDRDRNFHIIADAGYHGTVMGALTGKPIGPTSGQAISKAFFMYGLELGSDGFLQTNEHLMTQALQRCPYEQRLSIDDIPVINARLRRFAITPTVQISHYATVSDGPTSFVVRAAAAMPSVTPEDYADLLKELEGRPPV